MSATDLPLGLRYDLNIEAYHSGLAVSKSGLDCIERSALHYWAAYIDPTRPARPEPTPAMVLGTMTHCAVLEPGCFSDRYRLSPKFDRRTSAGKAEWASFCASLKPGQAAADPVMVQQANAMAAAVRRIKPVDDLLAHGHAEVSAYAIDPASGVLCRCRPDWLHPVDGGKGVVLVDLKTTQDASPNGFAKAVANFRYDVQGAFYSDIYELASGQQVHGFVLAAVEKQHPFAAAAYMLSDDALDRARRKYRRLLSVYAECRASGNWPGYIRGDEIRVLDMPAWATKEDDE